MYNVILYTIYERESDSPNKGMRITTPYTTENKEDALKYIQEKVANSLAIPPEKWKLETKGTNLWRLVSSTGFVEYELIENEIVKEY